MEKVLINLQENSYSIYIEKNMLQTIKLFLPHADKYFLITDKNVNQIYINDLLKSFEEKIVYQYIIEPGEPSKNFSNLEIILNTMIEKGLTRSSIVIAFGGGVVGDISGFCASIYMRGIGFIQIPTTLLGQVDSSVGGKTGVNMFGGKNMIGSFYQPQAVFIDTSTLHTLPRREVISGLGEIIKYGIIWDYKFLDYIDKNYNNILALEENTIKAIIKKCCTIKAEIVSQDEKETGLRKILNFGHTIGHSLEVITGYNRYTHGEAVLIGMYYETSLSYRLGFIESDYFEKVQAIICKSKINLDISEFTLESLIEIMVKDKKNQDGKISFILPKTEGIVEEVLLNKEVAFW